MRLLVVLAALLLLGSNVAATEYGKDDFAFGYYLEVDGQGAVYSLTIPAEIYKTSVQQNFIDIQIFNASGEVIPHDIQRQVDEEQLKKRVNIPFFPLYGKNKETGTDLSVEIKKSGDGEIVSVERKNGESHIASNSYLLDMDKADVYPVTLRLDWQMEERGGLVPLTLESSSDLIHWQHIANSTLADLEFMGNRLMKSDLRLPNKPKRYLRLVFGKGGEKVKVEGVTAISDPLAKGMKKQWVKLPLKLHIENDREFLQAEIPGVLPVDNLQLEALQPNSILKTHIYTSEKKSKWRSQKIALFYRLLENGVELKNEEVVINNTHIRGIRLEVIEDGAGATKNPPILQVGYIPQELFFVARGKGPFLLAFGNGTMVEGSGKNGRSSLKSLIGEKSKAQVRSATIKERVVLGGKQKLQQQTVRPWRKAILWGVLLVGVAILAVMALSLTRKMNKP